MVMVMVGKALMVVVVVTGDDSVLFWGSHYGNAMTTINNDGGGRRPRGDTAKTMISTMDLLKSSVSWSVNRMDQERKTC
jgi:hypothetical protein